MTGPRNGREFPGRDHASRVSARETSRRRERESELGLARRVNKPTNPASNRATSFNRIKVASIIAICLAIAIIGRMVFVQALWGDELKLAASEQRSATYTDPARRGEILDRTGKKLAYTFEARSLTASPVVLRAELPWVIEQEMINEGADETMSYQEIKQAAQDRVPERLEYYANEITRIISESSNSEQEIRPQELVDKLNSDTTYTVLVRNVDPDLAQQIGEKFWGITPELQKVRQYPNGAVASPVIGKINQDGMGQFGFEVANERLLAGTDGRARYEVSADGQEIPGSLRDQVPAQDGKDVTLTLDLDLQTYVQQQIEQAVANSKAKSGEAVVLDSATGQILAMANSGSINPMGNIEQQVERGKDFTNTAISSPFEPGSVAKIITAAGVIEDGKSTPDEVLQVPGSIDMAGVSVKDAWDHGVVPYTTTGVFGKSSNVGTLMLAQRLGEDRYADLLNKFGVGQATGVELPGESAGLLPARQQWSGGTWANLPIGQGMSWTVLQMASVYQALANDGVRIEPRLIKEVKDQDGNVIDQPDPKQVEVVSPETARTVVDMFQSVVQSDPTGVQQGTGANGAVEGYQISGKTGTAQQVDPNTGAYSNSAYWITFAGIAPADDPRYVIAIQLDQPQRGVHGEGGQSAAPLFADIASWLLNRDNVPLSPPKEGKLILEATE